MTSTRKSAIAVSILVVIVALVFFLLPDRESQVKKQLTKMCEYVEKRPSESMLTTVAKTMNLEALFAQSLSIEVESPSMKGKYSRKEVMDRINMLRRSFSRLTITLHDINISFPQESQAEVLLTMRVIGKQGQETYSDTREMEFILDKFEKKWLVSQVNMIDVLQQ